MDYQGYYGYFLEALTRKGKRYGLEFWLIAAFIFTAPDNWLPFEEVLLARKALVP